MNEVMYDGDECTEEAIWVTQGRGVALSRVREGLFQDVTYEESLEL